MNCTFCCILFDSSLVRRSRVGEAHGERKTIHRGMPGESFGDAVEDDVGEGAFTP